MKAEPLLKDIEEPIVFRNANKVNKSKNGKGWRACLNKSVILTVILTLCVFYYFGRTTFAFYIGFKYYDLRYMERVPVQNDNENIENNE